MQIQGAVALVTGANRGIGKSFVQALLDRGAAKVYAGARNPAAGDIADDRVRSVRLDVTDPSPRWVRSFSTYAWSSTTPASPARADRWVSDSTTPAPSST